MGTTNLNGDVWVNDPGDGVMHIVYKGDAKRGSLWKSWLDENAPELHFHIWPEFGDTGVVEVLIAWQPPQNLMVLFPNLRLVISTGAGADQFDLSIIPSSVRVVRMIEPGLTQGMVEYICFSVIGLHRDMPRYLQQQRAQKWQAHPAKRAIDRNVGVMGLGELGQAALGQLVSLGFDCHGWSRTPKNLSGVRCWHGEDELNHFLAHCEILICLLPLTTATRGLLNHRVFEHLPAGASLVHAGRGAQLNNDDLLKALDSGQLKAAVIDVTEPEPLPAGHPFWHHPQIWLTPHIASQTHAKSAIAELLQTLRCFQRNEVLKGEINRERGY